MICFNSWLDTPRQPGTRTTAPTGVLKAPLPMGGFVLPRRSLSWEPEPLKGSSGAGAAGGSPGVQALARPTPCPVSDQFECLHWTALVFDCCYFGLHCCE